MKTDTHAYEIVAPTGDICGEGAVWDPVSEAVYWCDINRFLLHRYDLASRSTRSWQFGEPVVALSLTTDPDRLLIALGSKLIWWWPETDRRVDQGFHTPGWPEVRLNDGRADPLGNFWVGSMANNVGANGEPLEINANLGQLYRIAPDGGVTVWADDIGISNTLCWSPDRTRFYFGDTLRNTIDVFHFDDSTGDIKRIGPFFSDFERGLPDGSAIDDEGCLWNCRFHGGCMVRVGPSGEILSTIDLPMTNITTAVFGGVDMQTLYVTTASDQKAPGDRLAGSLVAVRTAATGLAPHRVRIPHESLRTPT